MSIKRLFFVLIIALACFTGMGFLNPVYAQADAGLAEVGQTIKLSGADPRTIAANIINVVLGFLGIILLGMILYAGFLWMTSGGDQAKVQKAQQIIRNALIGLVIILSAWAIAYYVINVLLKATQDGGGTTGTGPGGCVGPNCFGPGAGSAPFKIASATPQGDETNPYNTNAKIDISFTQEINSAVIQNWNNYISVTNEIGQPVAGQWSVMNGGATWIRFTPQDDCVQDPNQKCFAINTLYSVSVDKDDFTSANDESLSCGGLYPACDFKFYIGDQMDAQAPNVTITGLYDYQAFCEDVPYVQIPATAVDNFGISIMEWLEEGTVWGSDGPSGVPTPKEFSSALDWSTVGKTLKQPYLISVRSTDIDNNTGSKSLHLTVLKDHCCNLVQDADEIEVDCGGADCLACTGGACSSNAQCVSGVCLNGVCAEQPIITNISPTSGKDGSFVSIWGANFGDTGTSTFLGPPALEAYGPQSCLALGVKTWRNNYILVEVPAGAGSGPIEVYNANSQLSDRTDQDPGPLLPDFEVNNVERPGICAVDPESGKGGISAKLLGAGFGTAPAGRVVGFGATALLGTTQWSNDTIAFNIPTLYAGWYWVGLKNADGTVLSNGVPFQLEAEPPQADPLISGITPDYGPTGQYVTVVGQRFGWEQGLVKFVDLATNAEINADTNFPPACGNGMWTNTQIVVKVPTMLDTQGNPINPLNVGSNPNFRVYIQRNKDAKTSNRIDFLFSNNVLGPGICKINPTGGPTGTVVQMIGERFGADQVAGDQVVFSSVAIASIYNSWDSNQVDVVVPPTAVTGPAYLQKNNLPESNKVQFLVGDCRDDAGICSAKQICCPNGSCADDKCPAASFSAMYGWQMTTGIVPRAPRVLEYCNLNPQPGDMIPPSPTPWMRQSGGDQVCVDQAKIGIMFNMPIEGSATDLRPRFSLKRCTGSGVDPCQTREDVAFTDFNKATIHINGNVDCSAPPTAPDCYDYITFEPAVALQTSAVYEVYVSDQVRSYGQYGDKMALNTACAEPDSGYCFRFQTRNNTALCDLAFVYMNPYSSAVEGGGTESFEALPAAKDGVCNLLSCKGFNWSWRTERSNLPTSLASMILPLNTTIYNGQTYVSCKQSVQAGDQEASAPPVNVLAQEVVSSVEGVADLYIKYLVPTVIDYSPNCRTACLNAYIWARFNTSLDIARINAENVEVFECKNENCLESDINPQDNLSVKHGFKISAWPETGNTNISHLGEMFGTSIVKANSFILIDPRDYIQTPNNPPLVLQENKYYLVRLKGGQSGAIVSNHQVLLPQTFIWKFRTAEGEQAYCTPERIMVYPSRAIASRIADRELFQSRVFSSPDECRADGQMLLVTSSFEWSVADLQIAKYAPFPPPAHIDADGALPLGCSSNCKATGAMGAFGQVALCGNDMIETTDTEYCNPQTTATKAGLPCMIMPITSGAGEQCDDKNDPKCNPDTCLWRNTPVVNAGTCGNYVVDWTQGEMCDPGLRCFGTNEGSLIEAGTPCESSNQPNNVTQVECEAQGGKCEIRNYLGCSVGCKNLGSSSVSGSECGNGALGYGEDCDQGGDNGQSGCSNNCLHIGSRAEVAALCGNGVLEPGENCEAVNLGGNLVVPDWCDPVRCLKFGNADFCTQPGETNCCGDGVVNGSLGEECDDYNHLGGDGCSSSCLKEGSSWRYNNPSLCGNGIVETGEACEAGTGASKASSDVLAPLFESPNSNPPNLSSYGSHYGNGLLDPMQIGEIVGKGTPDPVTKILATQLNIKYQSIEAQAVFGVRCGNVKESDCADPNTPESYIYGLDDNGCCNLRPKKVSNYPNNGSTDVCRNTLISATFERPMQQNSVLGNFIIAKAVQANDCPEGSVKLSLVESQTGGFWNWLAGKWKGLISWIKGEPVYAQVWCANLVPGQLRASADNKTYSFTLENALDQNTSYIVRFNADPDLADNEDLAKRIGIKTQDGVVALQDKGDLNTVLKTWNYTWEFSTGADICTINGILVEDLHEDHPTYFSKANEVHDFRATALALNNGKIEKISPVAEYNWQWSTWISNNTEVADISGAMLVSGAISETKISSKEKNGTAIINVAIEITSNTIGGTEQLTSSQIIWGALPIIVMICDNPWPELSMVPFRDMQDSPTLAGSIFEAGPYFNFQTMYCRDGAGGLLPELEVNFIPPTLVDSVQGILRQYLLTFKDPAYKSDGIGIRIMSNMYHDTLKEWYSRQGFVGNPQSLEVDGYEALHDGSTVYIGFPNTNPSSPDKNIYQNIFVVSRNVNAFDQTGNIFDQLVENLAFNINFEKDNSNICVYAGNGIPYAYEFESKVIDGYQMIQGKPVVCTADWDCSKIKPGLKCASYKFKLRRDMIRLRDFKTMAQSLFDFYSLNGYYPRLSEGTYLYGRTNSRWPSWDEALGPALGLGEDIPKDPVNRFVSCGFCRDNTAGVLTQYPCTLDSDCPLSTYSCEPKDDFDPQTCWNVAERKFWCPSDPLESRLYSFHSMDGGRRFELAANFELPPDSQTSQKDWWYPEYPTEVKACYTDSNISAGRWCESDDDCKACANPKDTVNCTVSAPAGSCRPLGRFKYLDVCEIGLFTEGGVCGDGSVGMICVGGGKNGLGCKVNEDCPNGACQNEVCELGQTKPATCTLPGGGAGTKLQVCEACLSWADDPKVSMCFENKKCGNGRIDGTCLTGQYTGLTCQNDQDCEDVNGPHACNITEVCDDGILNGTYGHCSVDCDGIDKYCGNSQLDAGETCDRGSGPGGNGVWCQLPFEGGCYSYLNIASVSLGDTCATDCKGKAPYCGDGKVYPDPSLEECDGNILINANKLCVAGENKDQPCQTSSDCNYAGTLACTGGDVCGGCPGSNYLSCENVTVGRCATGAKICASPWSLTSSDFFNNSNNTKNNYKVCYTDKDCTAGLKCVALSQAGGEYGGCTNNDQCSTTRDAGFCRQYDTAHVRKCNPPGNVSDQCKYELEWSDCLPQKYCGDGVRDSILDANGNETNEECDEGSANSYLGACLPNCKKNVCGDGYLRLNVEECDNGLNNGQNVCKAPYQSSCNDCTTQCRNMTASGGYCGNDIREASEQCDGNIEITQSSLPAGNYILPEQLASSMDSVKDFVGSVCSNPPCKIMKEEPSVTCQQLGFDFALNSSFYNTIRVLDYSKLGTFVPKVVQDYTNSGIPVTYNNSLVAVKSPLLAYQAGNLLLRLMLECEVVGLYENNGKMETFFKPQNEWPSLSSYWSCVKGVEQNYPGIFKIEAQTNDKPVCASNCALSGCGRCIEEPGDYAYKGKLVQPSILGFGQPIAIKNARITLLYNGIIVSQVFTDDKGKFAFNNLNNRFECDQYQLIIEGLSATNGADCLKDKVYYSDEFSSQEVDPENIFEISCGGLKWFKHILYEQQNDPIFQAYMIMP